MTTPATLAEVGDLAEAIRGEIAKAIVGQGEIVDHLLIALFARGHVLLEGPPGTAKTFLAQTFACALGLDFGRIQFTPDLMPGDILGSNLFNFSTSAFTLTRGPIFCEVLLADEINRTPPKTQAALLEAMQERRVTLDGEAHALPERFTVIATQNPIESQGVYPLPEAQLDRFLFKLLVGYPSAAEEARIVTTYGERGGAPRPADCGVTTVADAGQIAAAAATVAQVTLAEPLVDYIVRLIRATRETGELSGGASPRAAVLLAQAARARAALDGRDYGVPDDIKALAPAVLRHRLLLSPAAEIEGRSGEAIVAELVEATEARGEVALVILPSTRAAVLLAALAPAGLLLAAAAPAAWVLAPLGGLVLLALALIDAALAGRLLDGRCIAPGDAEIGEPLTIAVRVDLSRRPRTPPEAVLGLDPRLAESGRLTVPLAFEASSASWSGNAVTHPNRRGAAPVDTLWLRWRGPLGLGQRQATLALDRVVRVRPNLAPARSPALQMLLRDAQFGIVARRIRGEGSQFEALAEYEPGMDRRRIDWKSSARHVRLLAKEMEAERNLPVVFALDCGASMSEPVAGLPRIDRAVSAALTTAFVALKSGDRVALFGFAGRVLVSTPFVADTRQFHRLHAAAAELDYRAEDANFTLALSSLAARLQRRSLIVLFAEFTDPTGAELMVESVARLIERHRVLFVVLRDEELESLATRAPETVQAIGVAVAADALARQRAVVLTRLRRLGVDIVEAPYAEIGTRLLDAYLSAKRAGVG